MTQSIGKDMDDSNSSKQIFLVSTENGQVIRNHFSLLTLPSILADCRSRTLVVQSIFGSCNWKTLFCLQSDGAVWFVLINVCQVKDYFDSLLSKGRWIEICVKLRKYFAKKDASLMNQVRFINRISFTSQKFTNRLMSFVSPFIPSRHFECLIKHKSQSQKWDPAQQSFSNECRRHLRDLNLT